MGSEKPQRSDISDKLLNVDRRIVYVAIVVLIVVPLLHPIGLPITVDRMTQDYYNTIESLRPGAVALLNVDIEAGQIGEQVPGTIAMVQHLFDKSVKFIQIAFNRADSQIVFENNVLPKVDKHDKKYGVDWVNIGYVEGKETAKSAFAANFLFPNKDAYGNLLKDLPLMSQVKSAKDIDLLIVVGTTSVYEDLRQVSVPYGTRTIVQSMSMGVPDLLPYYPNTIAGIVSGLMGTAQYEFLRRKPGLAIRGQDAISATHIFLLALVVLTNAAYVIKRGKRERT